MNLTLRQIVFAVLAVAGLAIPWYFNLQLMSGPGGLSLAHFVAGGYANPAASSLTTDLTVAFLAFLVWLPGEARRASVPHWWIYVVLGFGVAFAFAFPLFLLVRERRLASA